MMTKKISIANCLSKALKYFLIGTILISPFALAGCSNKQATVKKSMATNVLASNTSKSNSSTSPSSDKSEAGVATSNVNATAVSVTAPTTRTIAKPISLPAGVVNSHAAGNASSTTSTRGAAPTATVVAKSTGATVNNGISALYGGHTYGCQTQAEYNAVMTKVKSSVANITSISINPYVTAFLNGDRAAKHAVGSAEYKGLTVVERGESYFLTHVSSSDALKIGRADGLYASLDKLASDPKTGAPSSAYDVLFRKTTDCDAQAQLKSAIYDSLGLSSVIIASSTHADGLVKANGQWWCLGKLANIDAVGTHHLTNPTF